MQARAVERGLFCAAAMVVLVLATLSWSEPGLRSSPAFDNGQGAAHADRAQGRPAEPDLQQLLLLVGVMQRVQG